MKFDSDLSKDAIEGVLTAIRWWASFGGVGARTRRGVGSLFVEMRQSSAKYSSVPAIQPDEAKAVGCSLLVQKRGHADAMSAWKTAIRHLKNYRQGTPKDRDSGDWQWPEAGVIRELHKKNPLADNESPRHIFPRALFGLPIIMHFKGDYPPDSSLEPTLEGWGKGPNRLASPIILHPLYFDGRWHPSALLLPYDEAKSMGLRVKMMGGEIADFDPGTWWSVTDRERVSVMDDLSEQVLKFAEAEIESGKVDSSPLQHFMSKFVSDGELISFPGIDAVLIFSKSVLESARPMNVVWERPTLEYSHRNRSITISPSSGEKPVVLCGNEAARCMASLKEPAQQRLKDPAKRKFNRLRITLEGSTFISLHEYKE